MNQFDKKPSAPWAGYPRFKRSLLATAILTVSSGCVIAQEEPAELEEIIVTGQRSNLQDAQAIKRDADTFVDAISAKDIGSLPDKSIIEAISRIPGVSIERFPGANDPDHFGTEGSGALIRGMTQVRTSFNGRDAFSANSGRGLSFQDVPPELAGGVSVYKNQTADLIEGGIGGTIDLRTRQPFDQDGQVIALSAEVGEGDLVEDKSTTFSGLFSNRWDTEAGEFGLLFSYSTADLMSQSQGVQIDTLLLQTEYGHPGGPNNNTPNPYAGTLIPKGISLREKTDERKRKGTNLSLQWESSDQTMVATANYVRSDSDLAWTEYGTESDENKDPNNNDYAGHFEPHPDTEFTFDGDINGAPLFESGVLVSTEGWRGDGSANQPWGGTFGVKNKYQTRQRQEENLVEDLSFNFKWAATERLGLEFDLQRVEATKTLSDITVGLQGRAGVYIGGVSGDKAPNLGFVSPDLTNDPGYYTNPANYFMNYAMDHLEDNEGEETAVRLDLNYDIDSGWARSIEAGLRWAEREQTTRESDYNWGSLSAAYRPGGNGWYGSELMNDAGLSEAYDTVNLSGFMDGRALNNISGGSSFIFPSAALVADYRNLSDNTAGLYGREWMQLADRDPAGDGLPLIGDYYPSEINETTGTNNAAFVKFNFSGELGGFDVDGNVGVRYVSLEHETIGYQRYPDFRPEDPDDRTDPDNALPADDKAFGNAAVVSGTGEGDFSTFLPSLNIKVGLTDDLIFRFAASKAVSLPDLGQTRYHLGISAQDRTNTPDLSGFNFDDYGDFDPTNPEELEAAMKWLVEESGQLEDGIPIKESTIGYYEGDGGNPYLEPMEAIMFDFSLEWYFADVGSLTATYFHKDVKNYFVQGTFEEEFTNNGVTKTVRRNTDINGDEGTIQGWELGYQQFFDMLPGGWSGIGVQANYTYVDEDGSPNPEGSDVYASLPFQGLSMHTYNLAAMYEKYGLSARLAYNWRSSYLLSTSDVITGLPVYNDDYGQVDGSIFYNINDNWTVGLQLSNITGATTKTSVQVTADGDIQARSWFIKDRYAAFVLRAVF
ncbi:MAG: TonB-dependent receptor [Pseudomonadales bacterium]